MLLITFYEILIRMCRIQRNLTVGYVGPFLHGERVTWQALQESGSNAREFDFLFGDHGSYMTATDHYQQSTYLQ